MMKNMLHSGERGMTLIEVLAVVVLIGLISVVLVKTVFTKSSAAKAKLNETRMVEVQAALSQYRLQYNKYPSRLEELLTGPAEAESGGSLFVPLVDESTLKDIWDFPFVYQVENNGRSYNLKSLGEDGVAGGTGVNTDVVKTP